MEASSPLCKIHTDFFMPIKRSDSGIIFTYNLTEDFATDERDQKKSSIITFYDLDVMFNSEAAANSMMAVGAGAQSLELDAEYVGVLFSV